MQRNLFLSALAFVLVPAVPGFSQSGATSTHLRGSLEHHARSFGRSTAQLPGRNAAAQSTNSMEKRPHLPPRSVIRSRPCTVPSLRLTVRRVCLATRPGVPVHLAGSCSVPPGVGRLWERVSTRTSTSSASVSPPIRRSRTVRMALWAEKKPTPSCRKRSPSIRTWWISAPEAKPAQVAQTQGSHSNTGVSPYRVPLLFSRIFADLIRFKCHYCSE